jgi:hypothetical protein
MWEPYTPSDIPNCIQDPPPPIEIDSELEQEIAEILNSRIDHRYKCKHLYLVKWLGYDGTDQETEWLPATELVHAQEPIADFHKAYPSKPGLDIP